MSVRKSYTECAKLLTYSERLEYLRVRENVYDSPREITNGFYDSSAWNKVREKVIIRDLGMDLGINGLPIRDGSKLSDGREQLIIVHHINPLQPEDFLNWDTDKLFGLDNLICCSIKTHNDIHYGTGKDKYTPVERTPGDTKLW